MSLIFPNASDLSFDDLAKLADAYELACDELVEKHGYSPNDLGLVLDSMTAALLGLYRAGQRDDEVLARYSASQALEEMRESQRFSHLVRGCVHREREVG